MSEDFLLPQAKLPSLLSFYKPRWIMKPFPYEELNKVSRNEDLVDPITGMNRQDQIMTEWTDHYFEGLLSQATDSYTQGNYKAALTYLDEAINSDAEPPLAAFNLRAATHIRLGNLGDALTDAGKMIRREKNHSTGYLRLAQILKMQGKTAEALRIYERALRQILPTDRQFQIILASRDELSSILAPKKLIDPLSCLAEELASDVMSRLEFRDIVRASQVCRSWRAFTFLYPSFWSSLDLTTGKWNPSFTTVRAYVQRSKKQIRALVLPPDDSDAFQQGKVLDYVVHSHQPAEDLQVLSIGSESARKVVMSYQFPANNLLDFRTSSAFDFDFDMVFEFLDKCIILESARFGSVTGFSSGLRTRLQHVRPFNCLQTLHISCPSANHGPFRWTHAVLDEHLIRRLPNIRNMKLKAFDYVDQGANDKGLSELQRLEILELIDSDIKGDLKLPTSLKHLDLDGSNCSISQAAIPGPQNYATHDLPNLTHLCLSNCVQRSGPMTTDRFLRGARGDLTHLDLSHMHTNLGGTANVFREEVFRNVKALGLAGLEVSDDNIIYLATVTGQLNCINLASTKVSGVGVKALVNGCKGTLEWIKLDNCERTSADAIEWARSSGIQVSYCFRDTVKKGRKVRQA